VKETAPRTYVARDGDRIKVSISHQIKVGRDESWVGYEISHEVLHTDEDIEAKLIEHANVHVMDAVDNAVEKIRSKS